MKWGKYVSRVCVCKVLYSCHGLYISTLAGECCVDIGDAYRQQQQQQYG